MVSNCQAKAMIKVPNLTAKPKLLVEANPRTRLIQSKPRKKQRSVFRVHTARSVSQVELDWFATSVFTR
jgi:hypothetical protein